jgi:putative metalloprotease
MLKLTPVLLAIIYGVLAYRLSVWRTARELDARSAELADPVLRQLTDRMAGALDLPRIRVHLYDIPQINGLAAPDGRIFITRGFLDRYRAGEVTAEELASVIAHELGHVALGHSRRRMIDFTSQNALRTALAMMFARFLPGLGVVLANLLTALVAARLSRQDEYAADTYASGLLIRSGIGTGPQKSLFGKLDSLAGHGGTGPPAWLLSHPGSAARIAAIEANEARWIAGGGA